MTNNDKIKNIAIKVLEKSNFPKNENHAFDPFTILMIISVILTLIRIIQECNKNKLNKDCAMSDQCSVYGEQIKDLSLRRGWFTKMRIKRILRREMSPEDYDKYSMNIINTLLDEGANLTDDDIQTLVEATTNV